MPAMSRVRRQCLARRRLSARPFAQAVVALGQAYPPIPLMTEREAFRMQHLGHHLQRVLEPRAGSVEVGVPVGDVGPPFPHSPKAQPTGCARRADPPPRACGRGRSRRASGRSHRDRRPGEPPHSNHGECSPASPNRFSPPAASTNSGIQLPAAIKGSVHSIQTTRGRWSSPAARSEISAKRLCIRSTTWAPVFDGVERPGDPADGRHRRLSWRRR